MRLPPSAAGSSKDDANRIRRRAWQHAVRLRQIDSGDSSRVVSQCRDRQIRCSEYNAATGWKPQLSERTGDPQTCKSIDRSYKADARDYSTELRSPLPYGFPSFRVRKKMRSDFVMMSKPPCDLTRMAEV